MPNEQPDDASFAVVLTHLSQDMGRVFSRQVGVSLSRMEMLHELWHAGEISQTELQQRLMLDGALITRFAKQMEADGLITRRVDPKDNRFTLVKLAPPGQQFIDDMGELGDRFESDMLAGVSEEDRANVIRVMKQIDANLTRMLENKPRS